MFLDRKVTVAYLFQSCPIKLQNLKRMVMASSLSTFAQVLHYVLKLPTIAIILRATKNVGLGYCYLKGLNNLIDQVTVIYELRIS